MKINFRTKAALTGAGTALLLAVGTASAGDAKMAMEQSPVADAWDFCDVFELGKLYKSDTGFINSFSLYGRYQGQYHWSDSDQGLSNDDWENRRVRAGIKVGFLNDFEFAGQFNLDVDGETRFFEDVEDLTIEWTPSDNFYAIIGKQKAPITREWSTSSTKIKTFERSQFVNQVTPDKIGGLVLGYNLTEALLVETGLYAGSNSEDWELPFNSNSSLAASLRVGYDVTEATNVRFDYFFADGAGVDRSVGDYDHIFSLNSESSWGRMHLVTDLIFAKGINDGNNSDAGSVVIMPYYDLTDKLEGVFRYTYSGSDGATGIRLQSRYERETAIDQRGDAYHAFYGGLNYYICEDKLKLMAGVEYATLDTPDTDYGNWTVFTGVRLSF